MSALFVAPAVLTVVSANQNSLRPATNAASDVPSLVWRSNNLTTVNVILDLGANVTAYDTVALIGTNLRDTDTVQVRTGTTTTGIGSSNTNAVAAFVGTVPSGSTAKSIIRLGSIRSERYLRIDIVSTGNPAGYVEAQRIVVGKALGLAGSAGVDLGVTQQFHDPSIMTAYTGGESYERYARLHQMKLTVSLIGDADWRGDWFPFLQQIGTSAPFLVVPDDEQPANWQTEAIYGRMTGQPAVAEVTSFGYRKVEIIVRALAP